jgi:hypothetical protein
MTETVSSNVSLLIIISQIIWKTKHYLVVVAEILKVFHIISCIYQRMFFQDMTLNDDDVTFTSEKFTLLPYWF